VIQEKKCKGTGQAKGYGCGQIVPVVLYQKSNRIYGLGISCGCYSKWLRESPKGQEKALKHILKATKPRRELEQAAIDKKARKSLGALKEQTQKLVNKYVRERDKGKPCISSGFPYQSNHDAGHCFPVGSYEGLRYDLDNIHGQSVGDNRFKDGNHIEYLRLLPNRIGKERTEALIQRAKDYKKNGYKFSREELYTIQENVKKLIKAL
jgi:hypothetical protein